MSTLVLRTPQFLLCEFGLVCGAIFGKESSAVGAERHDALERIPSPAQDLVLHAAERRAARVVATQAIHSGERSYPSVLLASRELTLPPRGVGWERLVR